MNLTSSSFWFNMQKGRF